MAVEVSKPSLQAVSAVVDLQGLRSRPAPRIARKRGERGAQKE
jgi:hypothetical protein